MRSETEIRDKVNELYEQQDDDGVDYRDNVAVRQALEWVLGEGEL